jgi:multiple sugar transport system permease protein
MASTIVRTARAVRITPRRFLSGGIPRYVFLVGVTVITLYPLFWMVLSSFRSGEDIATAPLTIDLHALSVDNYTALLTAVPLGVGFKNTAIVIACKGALTLFFCPLAGFAFAKYRFRGRNLLFTVLLSTLMVPPIVLIIPLLLEMGAAGWVNTYQALVLPGAVDAFSIFWMRQVIAGVPNEMLDAGRIDGCSPFGLYWRVVLPVIRPGLAALAVLTFIGIYNDFVWPVIAINSDDMQTLQVMLSALATQINAAQVGASGANAWGEILAASTLASLPVLILFVALQRHFVQGALAGSVKG